MNRLRLEFRDAETDNITLIREFDVPHIQAAYDAIGPEVTAYRHRAIRYGTDPRVRVSISILERAPLTRDGVRRKWR